MIQKKEIKEKPPTHEEANKHKSLMNYIQESEKFSEKDYLILDKCKKSQSNLKTHLKGHALILGS